MTPPTRARPADDAAHPPARRSLAIAAPAAEVWAVLEAPSHLERMHPFCDENPVHAWDDDRRDRIVYYSGLVLDRTFVEWRPEAGFRLDIGEDAANPSHHVVWDLEAPAADAARMTIAIHDLTPTDATDEGRPLLERYLDSVLRGLAHVVETGRPVTRNQFGPHPYFSPPT